jgi:transposase
VEIMRQIGIQQYWVETQVDGAHHIRLRTEENQPPGEQRIHSPYDPAARYSAKQATAWVGYKAYLSETCAAETVHLISHVETTSAVVQDVNMAGAIHAARAASQRTPDGCRLD